MSRTEKFQTVVVGAGQAGLATAYHLRRLGQDVVLLDGSERVGDSWRARWRSLRLYSPAFLDGLPGMPFPAPRHSSPTANEFADYLEAYAEHFELPIRHGVRVDSLSKDGDTYVITAGELTFEAENVVVATGVMQEPAVPPFATELDARITQLHSRDYRGPEQLQDGPVLVVGAAHSGSDIAYEVASAQPTILVGPDTGQIPVPLASRRMRLAWPVLKLLATRVLNVDTPIGRRKRKEIRAGGGPLLRYKNKDLLAEGVERVVGRMTGVRGGLPVLDGDRVVEAANVIWCTGFRHDYSWIELPLEVDEDGFPRQYRGAVAAHPGLYFVGMVFLHSFASMLIIGAVRDGGQVAEQIAARAGARAKTGTGARVPAAA